MMRSSRALGLMIILGGVNGASSASAQSARPLTPTPPLVSGRTIATPSAITNGDVLARIELLRDNLDLIRKFMGAPPAPAPLIRGRDATLHEALLNGVSVRLRTQTFAAEQLTSELPWRPPEFPTAEITPADVLKEVDAALSAALTIKSVLKIKELVTERVQPDTTSTTEIFNRLLDTAGMVNSLLEEGASGANAYVMATALVHFTMQLHLANTKKMMPSEPAFVPNKTPEDVFDELLECFERIKVIAESADVPVLTIERAPNADRLVTINDLTDLGFIMVAALDRTFLRLGMKRGDVAPGAPSRKYPSHVYQRVALLKLILEDIVQARGAKVR